MTVNVTPVNDAPTASHRTVTTNEDTARILTVADFGFSDVDSSDTLQAVTVTSLPTAGSLKLNGVAVIANQVVTAADITAGKLVFTPAANANGAGYASFGFKVSDGTALSASAYSMTVNVTPMNDAPTASHRTVTTNEDTARILAVADFGFSDVDSGDTLQAVTVTSLPAAGSLRLNGVAVTASQSISVADITAGKLVFSPAANANGAGYASFGFKVSDGTALSDSAYSMTVNVTPVNDAPTASHRTVTTNEDTARILAVADFGFSDVDSGDTLQAVTVTSLPAAGSLRLNGVAVTASQSISVADITAGKLVFSPAANANGSGYASFGFKVSDGTALSASAYSMTVNVTPVRDDLTLTGGVGNDTLVGDLIDIGSYDHLIGLAGNDSLSGLAGNDTLDGGAGNDTLNGGTGADSMTGGDGSDVYYVDHTGDVVTETNATASTGGTDTAYSYLSSYTLGNYVENGRILATGAASLVGNTLNNVLYAGVGNNTLNGSTGTDTVSYAYGVTGTAGVTVILSLSAAQATGSSGLDTLIAIENLTGSSYNDTLTGNTAANVLDGGSGNDTLDGAAGNDTLNGGTGADSMTGGDGSDVYYVDHTGDVVTETNATASTGGTDTAYSYLSSYTLGNYVENGRILATGAASLVGNTLNNVLYAGVGNNTLNGSTGTDTVSYAYGVTGTAGVTVILSLSAAQATGSSGLDTLIAIENLTGSSYNDTLTGNTAANVLDGGSGNDTLDGAAGNDTLNGGTGADSMTGGDGSDVYYVDHTGDVVTETNATASTGGTDTAYSYLSSYTLGNYVENGRILATGAASLVGNTLNNVLYAGVGNNTLNGSTGTDTVSYAYGVTGTAGVTVILSLSAAQATGSSGLDTLIAIENLTGSSYNDTLTGNTAANALDGGSGNDTLDGAAGNDTLNGGTGADSMTGGDGSDVYYVDHTGDVVTETNATASTGGTDTAYSYLSSYTLGNYVENGRILATGAASLVGNTLNNVLYAGVGNNTLNGSTGTDTVSYAYGVTGTAGVTVSLSLSAAQATGSSGLDTLIAIENLTGSSYNDTLTGNTAANVLDGGSGNDTLDGAAGNDTLNGGTGADSMTGGDGSDVYYVDHTGDVVTETNATASTGGTDTAYSYLSSYTLGNYVENGRILATGAASLVGNTLNNVLYAGVGNNTLNGSTGTDTVSYAYGVTGTAGVTVSLSLSATQATGSSGLDTLIAIENLTGSSYNDTLTGNTAANVLDGGSGNDTLDGAAGNDTLNGGTGADSMTGGDGSDVYYVDHTGDVVTETNATASTGGTDTAYSYLSSYTLGNYVENGRILATGAASLVGNTLNNVLYAGVGNNTLNGSTGTDTVSYAYGVTGTAGVTVSLSLSATQATGSSGLDTLIAIENLTGSSYNDTLTGNTATNVLDGGSGADTLDGGAGNDRLVGGVGKDLLTGSAGNDLFDFNALSEMGITIATWDVITDFVRGQDKIDLSTLDADTGVAGDQIFSAPVVGGTFSGVFANPGDLFFDSIAQVLYGNTDADAAAEFAIQLTGVSTLAATDLFL
jgi:Ca2+-binding RTX toxin-like protein